MAIQIRMPCILNEPSGSYIERLRNAIRKKECMVPIRVTKHLLQSTKGCTRKQAVEFNKGPTYTPEEFAIELERVKREFPAGGKKQAPIREVAVP